MEIKDDRSFFAKIPDNVKVAIARWWFAGAMYFMFGWGLGFSGLDGIFWIGVAIGVGHIFVLHPLVYSMFQIERNGKIINKKYYERTIVEGSLVKIVEILKCLICTFAAAYTYGIINLTINAIFDYSSDTQKVGAEPITFGIFFLIAYLIISFISNFIYKLKEKNKEKSSE